MRKIALSNILILCLGLIACNQTTDGSGSGAVRPTSGTNDVAAVNLNLGVEYLRLGQYEKALSKLEKAREADENYPPTLNSSDPPTLNNYGRFLCQEGRYDEAEATFLKAAQNPLYPTPEIALSNAGTCAMAEGNLESAERYFRSALEQNPRVAVALLQMAQISYTNASYLSARAYLQRYLEIGKHTAKTLWLGINIERELGDKNLLASYELLLKNKFPQSKEASLLEN